MHSTSESGGEFRHDTAGGCSLQHYTFRGLPEPVHLGHGGVMGEQPVPALIYQHYRPAVSALTRVSYGGQGGSGEVVRCGLNIGNDEVKGQRGSTHPVQMIVNRSGFVGAEAGADDVGFIRSRDVWVSESVEEANHVINGGNGSGARVLSGVSAVRVSRCGRGD